jgi:L,D-peptidoglycan transpeptidase YkuD (ErfK/YbiS/YcfS/YnhG family)
MSLASCVGGTGPVRGDVSVPEVVVRVNQEPDGCHRGILTVGTWRSPCVVGQGGLVASAEKREGDRRTPLGVFPLRYGLYDPVKLPAFAQGLAFPFVPMREDMIWEEDPESPHYNRLVFAAQGVREGDRLVRQRAEGLFDLVVPIGYNDSAPAPGRGSAIFLHAARSDGAGTAGCVAVPRGSLEDLARRLVPGMVIDIGYAGSG